MLGHILFSLHLLFTNTYFGMDLHSLAKRIISYHREFRKQTQINRQRIQTVDQIVQTIIDTRRNDIFTNASLS
jgi:hypothetical protein